MTSLDEIDHSVLDAYRTCEFATLARDGTPIAWPVSPFRQPDGTLLVTTSIGFAQKALNVRRDGRVALLFSDPTGSGLDAPVQVFLSGSAVSSDQPTTSPAGLEDYWSMLYWRQPSSRSYTLPGIRSVMDWYYMRLVITVTPRQAVSRPPGGAARPAAALAPGSPELAESWRRAAQAGLPGAGELAGYPTAVLAGRTADGGITLARTVPQPVDGGYAVAVPEDSELADGPASLLVHRHNDKLAGMSLALACGQVKRASAGGDWLLAPVRVIAPAAGSPVQALRRVRASAARYLRDRSLSRPAVPWAEYRAIARRPADRSRG